jgi:protein-glutamine gamma-glutamyltransferase
MESMDRGELFYVAPHMAIDASYPEITVDYPQMRLYRPAYCCTTQFRYTLGTTAIVDGEQLPLTPAAENEVRTTSLHRDDLPNLVKLAKQWIDQSHLPETDRVGRARCLERKLAGSGQFQYSLTGQDRDLGIDPIEDFITKHPQGHCEYFATALTLMLRSQGIPARMVSGFKCDHDDWNSAGGYYQVRQLHAHTWVEAYLPPDQLPANLVHGAAYWSRHDERRSWVEGGWLRLDATPAGATGERTDWFTPVRNGLDWLDGAWSKYVVELDCQTQRDAIYQPIADAARSLWKMATSARRWQTMFDSVSVALYLDHLGREAKWVLLGVVGFMVMLLLAGVGLLLVRIVRRLWSRSTGNHSRRRGRRGVEVASYKRFEGLMARQGLVRAPSQTQQEFAAAAGNRLASLTGEMRLATLPALIVDAFYRVRFGRTPLDNRQTQAVEQALAEIAAIQKTTRAIVGGDSSRRL